MADSLRGPCRKFDDLWRWIENNKGLIEGYEGSAAKQLRDALADECDVLRQVGDIVITISSPEGTPSE